MDHGPVRQLLHWYHAAVGHHHTRFVLVGLLLIVLVASLAVPYAVRLLQGLASYDLDPYEPKDLERAERLDRRHGDERDRAPHADR